jgi:hypothetical protein
VPSDGGRKGHEEGRPKKSGFGTIFERYYSFLSSLAKNEQREKPVRVDGSEDAVGGYD